MRKTSDSFSFEVPDTWTVFKEANRFVAQGAGAEELIVSSSVITGPPTATSDATGLTERLFANAKRAAEETAADSGLRITKEFGSAPDAGGWFPCWTIYCETIAQDLFFGQAIVRGEHAVLLVTYEAPYSPHRGDELEAFLATFGPPES